MGINLDFWKSKRVLVTGHTGFKGSWLSLWLQKLGANVIGYALPPSTNPNLFEMANIAIGMTSILSDINDAKSLNNVLQEYQPEIILHLAAQPLVLPSYQAPVETFATNIMGTINLLEAARAQKSVRAIVVVTSDKCYENREWLWGYRENEAMGGHDPYSCSKGCVELISASYRNSFFHANNVALATARAGNVIGGGDWSKERLVPDILKAIETKSELIIRNPLAIRPWQHVLEPLSGYLMLAESLYKDQSKFSSAWNFGPSTESIRPVKWIVEYLSSCFGGDLNWKQKQGLQSHEAQLLSLDSAKAYTLLGWRSQWSLEHTLTEIATWHKAWLLGKDIQDICLQQISSYFSNFKS